MHEKEREESIEERKARMNEYLFNQEMSRLKGVVECLVDVGRELEDIDCKDIRKKSVVRSIEELEFYVDEKYKPLLNKEFLESENSADFLGRNEGYRAMLQIIRGVIRVSGYR